MPERNTSMSTEIANPEPVMTDQAARLAQLASRPARTGRPHPARRARRITGVAGFAAAAVIAGTMAAGASSSATATNAVSANLVSAATATAATTATRRRRRPAPRPARRQPPCGRRPRRRSPTRPPKAAEDPKNLTAFPARTRGLAPETCLPPESRRRPGPFSRPGVDSESDSAEHPRGLRASSQDRLSSCTHITPQPLERTCDDR